jgi:hypothetical protein
MASASLVLGIISIIISFIPIINNLSVVMGGLAVILGLVSIKNSKGKAVSGFILGILSIIIAVNMMNAAVKTINEIGDNINTATGGNTEQVMNNVDVTFGKFETSNPTGYLNETKLNVTVTNKATENKSFTIQVEAVDENGDRIQTDYLYANNLNPGQAQTFEIFNFISSDLISKMKTANFKVLEASIF